MAIDWKTIISGFDGKPTLLQAIGKLRKAVEDETITIQQAQAEIAKLESQQKADEALITTAQSTADEAKINAYNASQKGDQALGKATTADTKAQAADTKAQAADTKAQAADTKAQNALDLATTNGQNITKLDSKVVELEQNKLSKNDITAEPSFKSLNTTNYVESKRFQNNFQASNIPEGLKTFFEVYYTDVGARTVQLFEFKANLKSENAHYVLELPLKSGTLATTDEVAQTKIYRHQLTFTSSNSANASKKGYAVIYSSKNMKIVSLANLKTILGNTFVLPVCGQYVISDGGNEHYYDYCFVTESKIYVRSYYRTDGVSPDEQERIITDVANVTWSHITINDTVRAI